MKSYGGDRGPVDFTVIDNIGGLMNRGREILRRLAAIVGRENVSCAAEDRICHGYDASRMKAIPDYVVTPAGARQVSDLLVAANEMGIPVYPRGAATGLTGGALALRGGIALDMSRMRAIRSIDPDNGTGTAEAGVVLADFQAAAEKKGLFYPPDPASREFCTIGGTLAECAGGLRCVKYGVTRDYLLSAEAVLPTGEIIHTGSRTMKSVVGYDLGRLLVGSEGTLCVFTEATFKLIPLPESVKTMMAFFSRLMDCVRAVLGIFSEGVLPSICEIMDETTISCIRDYRPFDIPPGTRALLLVETDGSVESAAHEMDAAAGACRGAGALSVETASDEAEAALLWEVRRSASPALYSFRAGKINEDVCVPRSRMPELFRGIEAIAASRGVPVACFGHAGDGNIHVNALYDPRDENERRGAEEAAEDLFRLVIDLGGSISGEHGIGVTKARFLGWEVGERERRLMREIKRLLDPNNILNPGKIFTSDE